MRKRGPVEAAGCQGLLVGFLLGIVATLTAVTVGLIEITRI